jgi:small subunit ribosomal protein S3Ae
MAEQVAKLKKKQWYSIIAPKQFDNAVIGETLAYEPGAMLGKTLSHSLMNLTNDTKRQNIYIHFKVVEIDGEKAKTSIIGYEIIHSSVKRFVRRNSEKIDMSFTCETSDNVFLRVKPLIVTRSDVKDSIASKIRNNAAGILAKTIKKMT